MMPFFASLILAQVPISLPTPTGYTRFETKADGTLVMSTAAQRFVAPGKPVVWLVGAIHIGQKSYYQGLQRLLDYSDEVYYEGVKPAPGTAKTPVALVKTSGPAPKPVYKILSDAIGLDFQLLDIDYTKPNWKNIDLDWAQLDALNKAESNGKPSQFDQVKGMLDPNGAAAKSLSGVMGMATPGMKEAIKIFMIKAAGSDGGPGLDPATEKIILRERNKTVIEAIDAATNSATPPRAVAVFYGAKHMADLQNTLVEKYGYTLDEKRWFPAAKADPKKVDATGQMMLDQFDKAFVPKKTMKM